ncbi:MAG: DUF4090 family protein [Rivularia sp. (in: cyanobacteria)]
MTAQTNQMNESTKGADAVDEAIAQGIDLDGSAIEPAKLDLYNKVMGLEGDRQRSGVKNTMRSRIVRIGAKHISQAELNQMLEEADFAPLKEKEIAFYYGGK